MDLAVNIPLEGALDRGWQILAACFEPVETGLPTRLVETFWPRPPGEAARPGGPGAPAVAGSAAPAG
jgi:V/A-type H+-transporting ATPase subunit B